MNPVLAYAIAPEAVGLANQINALINAIVRAHLYGIRVLVTDDFYPSLDNDSVTTSWATAIDFGNFAAHVRQEYGVVLVDRWDEACEITYAAYGSDEACIDVSAKIRELSTTSELLPASLEFNSLFGDPCANVAKRLTLCYEIDGVERRVIWVAHEEFRSHDIYWNLTQVPATYMSPPVLDAACISIAIDLQRRLSWYPPIRQALQVRLDAMVPAATSTATAMVTMSDRTANRDSCLAPERRQSVVHLRTEPDALAHWAAENNQLTTDFAERLRQIYLDTIRLRCRPHADELTILSGEGESDPLVGTLRSLGYTVHCFDKLYRERQYNAIVDCIRAEKCNGVFIGGEGSTFSALCARRILRGDTTVVLIDLNQLDRPVRTTTVAEFATAHE